MKKLSIDRIEGNFAVCECEDLSHISVSLDCFGFEVKEGMIVFLHDDGTYERAREEEDDMRRKIAELQNKLRAKSGE